MRYLRMAFSFVLVFLVVVMCVIISFPGPNAMAGLQKLVVSLSSGALFWGSVEACAALYRLGYRRGSRYPDRSR